MRCKNCGWNNPDTAERCEKCNRPLVTSTISSSYAPQVPRPSGAEPSNNNRATRFDANLINNAASAAPSAPQPMRTVAPAMMPQASQPVTDKKEDNRATQYFVAPQADSEEEETPANCPSCGYPLSPGSTVCPMCGTSLKKTADKPAYEASLTCMDDDTQTVINISAPKQLSLQSGDIVLIGGLRYKVN